MFKKGMFVVTFSPKQPNYQPRNLWICVDELNGALVADANSHQPAVNLSIILNSAYDREATKEEIQRIMNGRDFPDWVLQILKKTGPKLESATLHPAITLPDSYPKDTPQKPLPALSALTTFQSGCNHKMLDYIGFRESYKWCVHCDKKERV